MIPGEGASSATIAITATIAVACAAGAIAAATPWLTTTAHAAGSVPLSAPTTPAAPDTPPEPVTIAARDVAAQAPTAVPSPPPPEPARACAPRLALGFAYARAAVPSDAAAQLAPIVAYASEHPDATVLVDGHADPSGAELDNLVLSKRRANAVARLLRRAGLDRARIVVRAFGAYVPVPGEAARELRRVQVSFTDDPCAGKESP